MKMGVVRLTLGLLLVSSVHAGLPCLTECMDGKQSLVTRLSVQLRQIAESIDARMLGITLDSAVVTHEEKRDFEVQRALAAILVALWQDDPQLPFFLSGEYYENHASTYQVRKEACVAIQDFRMTPARAGSLEYNDLLGDALRVYGRVFRKYLGDSNNAMVVALMNSEYKAVIESQIDNFLASEVRLAVALGHEHLLDEGIPFQQPLNASIVIDVAEVEDEADDVIQLGECVFEKCSCPV